MWFQFGDVMLNLAKARRITYEDRSTWGRPAPTVLVQFGGGAGETLHGADAAKLWRYFEETQTRTREEPPLYFQEERRQARGRVSRRRAESSQAATAAVLRAVFGLTPERTGPDDPAPEDDPAWVAYFLASPSPRPRS